jgi:hypothetical protein
MIKKFHKYKHELSAAAAAANKIKQKKKLEKIIFHHKTRSILTATFNHRDMES